ncbi:uncharacterized protein [Ptychodera flava]|uniref:uncharacterized protein n=1 Tax=Ptychodera flava TaxID=63121 RepID=UPI003969D013
MISVTIAFLLASSFSAAALQTRLLGTLQIEFSAYTSVFKYDSPDKYDLFVTTFDAMPFTLDDVHMVTDIGSKLNELETVSTTIISDDIAWPNEIEEIPEEAFGEEGHLWIASGFLVPTKHDGAINTINPKVDGVPAPHTIISIDPGGNPWFYHRVEWVDMNNDGLKDALTARARDVGGGTYVGELVWFENSGSLNPAPWVPHFVIDGPDCYFRKVELTLPDDTTVHCVISAQYFSEQLTIAWTDDPNGSWTDPTQTHIRVIDEGIGRYFDLEVADLNMDGRLDLLVSVNRNFNGTLVAYEIPDNFIKDEWPRHLLADGFDGGPGEGNGAPGSGFTFRPASEPDRNKPLILLSGDDDGTLYMIEPFDDTDVSNWNYFTTALWTVSGTLGGISAMDVDNDGYEEVFLPAWTKGETQIVTFAP